MCLHPAASPQLFWHLTFSPLIKDTGKKKAACLSLMVCLSLNYVMTTRTHTHTRLRKGFNKLQRQYYLSAPGWCFPFLSLKCPHIRECGGTTCDETTHLLYFSLPHFFHGLDQGRKGHWMKVPEPFRGANT